MKPHFFCKTLVAVDGLLFVLFSDMALGLLKWLRAEGQVGGQDSLPLRLFALPVAPCFLSRNPC